MAKGGDLEDYLEKAGFLMKDPLSKTAQFLLGKTWWHYCTRADVRFLAGLACLIIHGASIKARRDALLARPRVATPDLMKEMRAIGGWEWEEDDKVFISYYPRG